LKCKYITFFAITIFGNKRSVMHISVFIRTLIRLKNATVDKRMQSIINFDENLRNFYFYLNCRNTNTFNIFVTLR